MGKRILACCIVLGLLCSVVPSVQAASDHVLVAINEDLSDRFVEEGYFSSVEDAELSLQMETSEIYDQYYDEATDTWMTVLAPQLENLPVLSPSLEEPDEWLYLQAEYQVADTFRLTEEDSRTKNMMQCLYVGDHCTVWGSQSDPKAVRLQAGHAAKIGESFDGWFDQICQAFGGDWYDADGDKKLAIMCYDLDHEYGSRVGTYTAGYFWMKDLISESGKINHLYYGRNNHINGIDCIHIDTYPAMGGYGDYLGNVENCYSTVVHEFQHMINFSYTVKGNAAMDVMETYLNEAFSMAAQHMICGAEDQYDRVDYFNGRNYQTGWPLTYWTGSLSNYANSYLFGQYLRTQYGEKTGTDGNSFFMEVFKQRNETNAGDTMSIIEELLDRPRLQIVKDFWAAVYLKNASGVHGFGGEAWADRITPKIYANVTDTDLIYNGGARFYSIGSQEEYPVSSSNALSFLILTSNGVQSDMVPHTQTIQANRTGTTTAELVLQADGDGTVYYDVSADPITDRSQLRYSAAVVKGQPVLCTLEGLRPERSYRIYYYLSGTGGKKGELASVAVPEPDCVLTIEKTVGGTLTVTSDGQEIESGSTIPAGTVLEVRAEAEPSYLLDQIVLDGRPLEGETVSVSADHVLSATFLRGYSITAVQPAHGVLTLSATAAPIGAEIAVTVQPDPGYSVEALLVDGKQMTGNTFTVTGDHTVTAVLAGTVVSGACGALQWQLTDTGTFYLTGNGPMENYAYPNEQPWYDCRDRIKQIIAARGITSIGDQAFADCENLTALSLPEGIQRIGTKAFRFCENLKTVDLPDSVYQLEDEAFWGCGDLEQVTFGMGIQYIGMEAFWGCSRLEQVLLPDSVKELGAGAFSGCDGIREICLPAGLTAIPEDCFHGCSSLEQLVIPYAVSEIGDGAFSSCYGLSLELEPENENLEFRDDLLLTKDGKTAIFCRRTAAGTVTVPDGVERIAESCFEWCADVTKVVLPDTVKTIGAFAFSDCSWLEHVNLPSSVRFICEYAFYGCRHLERIEIPEGVAAIGYYAFGYCTRLQQLDLPESIRSIGDYAFGDCSGLTAVTLPSGLQQVGDAVFGDGLLVEHCQALQVVHYRGSAKTWSGITLGDSNELLLEKLQFAAPDHNYVDGSSMQFDVVNSGEAVLFLGDCSAGFAVVACYDTLDRMVECCVVPLTAGDNGASLHFQNDIWEACSIKLFVLDEQYAPRFEAVDLK